MSYEAMHKVRASGLSDRTQVDVLEALAFFLNKETGACFPSTEAISRISRVNDRLVRTTLKTLHSLGLISSTQKAGQKRYFTLHLDRLPLPTPLQEVTGVKENAGGEESTPLYETTPLKESAWEGCRKVQGTPVEKCSSPLYETTPEQVNEQVIKQVKGTSNSLPAQAPWETDHLTNDGKKVEKPKATRAKPKTSCPFSPDDPIPPEYLEYARAKHPSINAQAEFTKFVNFHLSKDNKFSDWLAAWRTWTTKAEEFAKSRPQSQAQNPQQNFPFGKPTDPQYGIGVCERPKILPREFTPEESRRAREEVLKKYWNTNN